MQVNGKELAAIFGVSRARVSQWTRDGVLRVNDKRRYDVARSVQAVMKHLKQGQAGARVGAARERYLDEQQRRLKLQNDQRAGDLVHIEDVEFSVQAGVAVIVQHLNALPGRCAGRLAAESDPAMISAFMRDEVRAARTALADALRGLADST